MLAVCVHASFLFIPPVFKQNGSSYFGALVGRVANRVAKGRFVLDGKAYHLYINDGKNALHGTLLIVLSRSLSRAIFHGSDSLASLVSPSLFIRWPQGFQQGHLDGEGVRA